MDLSITIITPEIMRTRGADAFDAGLRVDDHGMNLGAPAIKDWQIGWLCRQRAAHLAAQQLAEVSPP